MTSVSLYRNEENQNYNASNYSSGFVNKCRKGYIDFNNSMMSVFGISSLEHFNSYFNERAELGNFVGTSVVDRFKFKDNNTKALAIGLGGGDGAVLSIAESEEGGLNKVSVRIMPYKINGPGLEAVIECLEHTPSHNIAGEWMADIWYMSLNGKSGFVVGCNCRSSGDVSLIARLSDNFLFSSVSSYIFEFDPSLFAKHLSEGTVDELHDSAMLSCIEAGIPRYLWRVVSDLNELGTSRSKRLFYCDSDISIFAEKIGDWSILSYNNVDLREQNQMTFIINERLSLIRGYLTQDLSSSGCSDIFELESALNSTRIGLDSLLSRLEDGSVDDAGLVFELNMKEGSGYVTKLSSETCMAPHLHVLFPVIERSISRFKGESGGQDVFIKEVNLDMEYISNDICLCP